VNEYAAATQHIRRVERVLMAAAAGLAVVGFLGYYLPVYRAPHLFPAVTVTVPLLGSPARLPWGELLWAVLLTTLELQLLVVLNLVGVHEIAVATGFLTSETERDRTRALLSIGLERKTTEVTRYGIDPFEGLQSWMLFVFNLVLRLKEGSRTRPSAISSGSSWAATRRARCWTSPACPSTWRSTPTRHTPSCGRPRSS